MSYSRTFLKTKYIIIRNRSDCKFGTTIGVSHEYKYHGCDTHNVSFLQVPMYSNIIGCHGSSWLYEFRRIFPFPFSFNGQGLEFVKCDRIINSFTQRPTKTIKVVIDSKLESKFLGIKIKVDGIVCLIEKKQPNPVVHCYCCTL